MTNIRRDVARRQAFGPGFNRTSRDRALADALLERRLVMSPHPEWRIPVNPTWDEDPLGDSNWQFQYHSLRWLDPLRRVAETGDKQAAQMWERHARSWVECNPPGASTSPWAWVDMGDALRAMTLTFGLQIVEDDEWLLQSLVEHGMWLSDDENIGRANHSLHQHQALFLLGKVLRIDYWADTAVRRLWDLLLVSYDEEGVNEEGSIAYHENNYHWWKIALRRLTTEHEPLLSEAARIDKALDELAHATRPNGSYERIGDIDKGGPARLSSPALDYINSAGARGTPPSELTKVFDRGYVFGRSGWGQASRAFKDETFYSISFGRADRVHGHQDGGSVTLFSQTQPWLIDTGKYMYGNDVMRAYVLGRTGHNVVVIEGRIYDKSSKVVLERHSISEDIDDFHFLDRGYHGVELRRRVTYLRAFDMLIITDTVRAGTEASATQLWHLDSRVTHARSGNSLLLCNGTKQARMQWVGIEPKLSTVRASEDPFEGWTSEGWRSKSPSSVIKATSVGNEVQFCTLIQAGADELYILDPSSSADTLIFNGRGDGSNKTIHFTPARVWVSCD